jgi:hypothetical protein
MPGLRGSLDGEGRGDDLAAAEPELSPQPVGADRVEVKVCPSARMMTMCPGRAGNRDELPVVDVGHQDAAYLADRITSRVEL